MGPMDSPRSSPADQLARHSTPREMQLVMNPHIQALCKDMNNRWPQVDPELVCLLYICERHKLHPPTGRMDLWRRDVAKTRYANTREPATPSSPAAQRPTSANCGAGPRRKFMSPASPPVAREIQEPDSTLQVSEMLGARQLPPTRSAVAQRDDANIQMYQGPLPATSKAFSQKDVHWQSAMSTAAATDLVGVEERSPHVQPPPPPQSRWSWKPDPGSAMPDYIPGRPESMASQSTRYATPTPADRDMWTASPSPEPWSGIPETEDLRPHEDSPNALAIADGHAPEDYGRTPAGSRMSPCLTNRLGAIRDNAKQNKGGAYLRSVNNVVEILYQDTVKHASFVDPRRDIKSFETRIASVRNEVRGRFVRNVPLLSLEVLSEEEQFWVISKAAPIHYEKGDVIVEEGSHGDDLYIVESGSCIITKNVKGENRRICDLKTGEHFGELAVMYDMPRAATVTARTQLVKLLKLTRADIFSHVSKENLERMKFVGRMQLFGSIPLLSNLERKALSKMIKAMQAKTWDVGKAIVSAGDRYTPEGRRLYFLEKGVCEVTQGRVEMKKRSGHGRRSKRGSALTAKFMSIQTGKTGVGHSFGMFELVYNCPQMTTVLTLSPAMTLSINHIELQKALGDRAQDLFDVMRRSLRIQLLRQSHDVLSNCDEEELVHLMEVTGGFKKYQPWEVIVSKGQRLEGLFVLEEGGCLGAENSVESLMDCRFESVDCAEHNRPGDTFGTRNTCRELNTMATFSLVAVSVCSILHVPPHYFDEIENKRRHFESLEAQEESD